MRHRISIRLAAAAALATALVAAAQPAAAHLLPARRGTVNVVGTAVYAALSVPASAFIAVDDDHDGTVDQAELARHEEEVRAEVARRMMILDGDTVGRAARIDLLVSPDHDAAGARADQIVVLQHATFATPPSEVRVRCDLFGAGEGDRTLTLTATRQGAAGPEQQVGVLRPEASEVAFFTPPPSALSAGAVKALLAAATALLAAALGRRAWARPQRALA